MGDISKMHNAVKPTKLIVFRATAIQGMNDASFNIRHMMYMTGHKNELSVKIYNRDCSTEQKKVMSDT